MSTLPRRKRTQEASQLLREDPPTVLSAAFLEPHELEERNNAIKAEHRAGLGYTTIGKRYNLSPTRVKDIIFPNNRKRRILTTKPNARTTRRKRISTAVPLPMENGASADEFRNKLQKADLSQKRFAKYMGLSEITVNNWAVGRVATPVHVFRFLDMCITMRRYIKVVRKLGLDKAGELEDSI